jgi:hypothetical protein
MAVIRLLNRRGDSDSYFSPDDMRQLECARQQVEGHIRKGGLAFAFDKPGAHGERIYAFKADAHEILLAPRMVGG